jgi:hypothetical protein
MQRTYSVGFKSFGQLISRFNEHRSLDWLPTSRAIASGVPAIQFTAETAFEGAELGVRVLLKICFAAFGASIKIHNPLQ